MSKSQYITKGLKIGEGRHKTAYECVLTDNSDLDSFSRPEGVEIQNLCIIETHDGMFKDYITHYQLEQHGLAPKLYIIRIIDEKHNSYEDILLENVETYKIEPHYTKLMILVERCGEMLQKYIEKINGDEEKK